MLALGFLLKFLGQTSKRFFGGLPQLLSTFVLPVPCSTQSWFFSTRTSTLQKNVNPSCHPLLGYSLEYSYKNSIIHYNTVGINPTNDLGFIKNPINKQDQPTYLNVSLSGFRGLPSTVCCTNTHLPHPSPRFTVQHLGHLGHLWGLRIWCQLFGRRWSYAWSIHPSIGSEIKRTTSSRKVESLLWRSPETCEKTWEVFFLFLFLPNFFLCLPKRQ